MLWLVVAQCLTLLWLHLTALRRNRVALQKVLSMQSHGPLWIHGRTYSFHLCPDCIAQVLK